MSRGDFYLKVKTRIKELREQKGITQLKMALDLNMNQNLMENHIKFQNTVLFLLMVLQMTQ